MALGDGEERDQTGDPERRVAGRLDLGATPTTLASTLAPTDGAWHQVTFTYDGTSNKLYLDGALQNTTAAAHQSAATTVAEPREATTGRTS